MHGGEDLVGHRGRSGYAQEFAAVADGHGDWLSCRGRTGRSGAFDGDDRAARGALAEFDQFRVFGRTIPALERGHVRELYDDEALGLRLALEHFMRTAAHDEAAAMLLNERQYLTAVFGVDIRVVHFDVSDQVGGHGITTPKIGGIISDAI